MKKVVLILPDRIECRFGSSCSTRTSRLDLTPETLLRVLGPKGGYHDDHFIRDLSTVKILSIEPYEEDHAG